MSIKYAKILGNWQYDGYVKKIYVDPYLKNNEKETDQMRGPGGCYGFVAIDLEKSQLVGLFEYYFNDDSMEIGLALNPALIGKGLAKNFVLKGVEFGVNYFDYAGDYVKLHVNTNNVPAVKAYRQAGFALASQDGDKLEMRKTVRKWQEEYPLLKDIIKTKEVFWFNPNYNDSKSEQPLDISLTDIYEAEKRLKRFAPYIKKLFAETRKKDGLIESDLENINDFKDTLNNIFASEIKGNLLIKRDDSLPIAGSIKARGGIYEVLKHAEDLALQAGLLSEKDNYTVFASQRFKNFFSEYSLAVGSTGNLGLSIGIMGTTLGFKTTVHMSADAKAWKKELLREKGAIVKEYSSDYSEAVKAGRKESEKDAKSYFIDDENSKNLFLGYAVAALRLKEQFVEMNIIVDKNHPLYVYLPCGVGGGPGGITFGLKMVFNESVECFFAEPTHSPAMLIGMLTGEHDKISVQQFGIDNKTAADGLAVGRPSKLVGKLMEPMLTGIYTVQDDILFKLLEKLYKEKNIKLEPSALAGFPGPARLSKNKKYQNDQATHLLWATGGSMVPDKVFQSYL